jgi:lysophospholipase L1-like esterase
MMAAIALSNSFVDPPRLHHNELFMMWNTAGKDYFVPAPGRDGAETQVTNPELLRLGNPMETFQARKQPGVFRIICIGGSVTEGWPFQHLFSYPQLLELILRDVLPDRKIEVINAGISGSDSSSDQELERELLKFEPDLLLINEGNIESWNLVFHSGWQAAPLRWQAWLFRNVHFYGRLYYKFVVRSGIADDYAFRRRAELAGDENRVLSLFINNVGVMVSSAHQNHCETVLLTQFIPPAGWGDSLIRRVNDELRRISERDEAPVVDIDKAFAARSSSLLIPPPFIHPDIAGYVLFAKTVARQLSERGLIAPSAAWRWGRLRPDADYLQELRVTPDRVNRTYGQLGRAYAQANLPKTAKSYFTRAHRSAAAVRKTWEPGCRNIAEPEDCN